MSDGCRTASITPAYLRQVLQGKIPMSPITEASNYLKSYFYKTLDHAGDEEINDEILKLSLKTLHARGYVRYTDLDDNGKRIMRAEQVTDERNQSMPGFYAYGVRVASEMALQFDSPGNDDGLKRTKIQRPGGGMSTGYMRKKQSDMCSSSLRITFFNNGFRNTG